MFKNLILFALNNFAFCLRESAYVCVCMMKQNISILQNKSKQHLLCRLFFLKEVKWWHRRKKKGQSRVPFSFSPSLLIREPKVEGVGITWTYQEVK